MKNNKGDDVKTFVTKVINEAFTTAYFMFVKESDLRSLGTLLLLYFTILLFVFLFAFSAMPSSSSKDDEISLICALF